MNENNTETGLFIDKEKEKVYYFEPYTDDEGVDFDVELFEDESYGTMWTIHEIGNIKFYKELLKLLESIK